MHKQMFDLGEEEGQSLPKREAFREAWERRPAPLGLLVLPVCSLYPDHFAGCEASGCNMGLILINLRCFSPCSVFGRSQGENPRCCRREP